MFNPLPLIVLFLYALAQTTPTPTPTSTSTSHSTCTIGAVTEGFTIYGYTTVTPAPTFTASAYVVQPAWSSAHNIGYNGFGNGSYCDYKCQYNCGGSYGRCVSFFVFYTPGGYCDCKGFDAELTQDLLVAPPVNVTGQGHAYDYVCYEPYSPDK